LAAQEFYDAMMEPTTETPLFSQEAKAHA